MPLLEIRKIRRRPLSRAFLEFFESEKASGIVMIVCTMISLALANSPIGKHYLDFWHHDLAGMSVEVWINDLLMAIFFLLIGLELEREMYNGELSNLRTALLPIFAALGGIVFPAAVHFYFNQGLPTQAGVGIPMATDIAFALGVLALVGSSVPASLKVFLAALAVIDDLCAIIIIAVFYSGKLSIAYLLGSLAVWVILFVINKYGRVMSLIPYMIGGALMWFLMLKSGVHATIAGVLLAFTIPFSAKEDDVESPSYRLEHFLHKPVGFIILPIFALANTGIILGADSLATLSGMNEIGIMAGLVVGKPLGIVLLTFAAIGFGIAKLPLDLGWKHLLGAGLLGGIGFTMSIFITNLAFVGNAVEISGSKMAILLASLTAGTVGFVWLKAFGRPLDIDDDVGSMDFEEEDP